MPESIVGLPLATQSKQEELGLLDASNALRRVAVALCARNTGRKSASKISRSFAPHVQRGCGSIRSVDGQTTLIALYTDVAVALMAATTVEGYVPRHLSDGDAAPILAAIDNNRSVLAC